MRYAYVALVALMAAACGGGGDGGTGPSVRHRRGLAITPTRSAGPGAENQGYATLECELLHVTTRQRLN